MARSLDAGSSEFIDIGVGTPILDPPSNSVSVWVYPTSLVPAYSAITSIISGGNYRQLFFKSDGKIAIYLNGSFYDGTGSHTLSTGNWYHLAYSYISGTGLVGYVNGASDGTGANVGDLTSTGAAHYTFGKDAVTAGRIFTGRMADVAMYNIGLTANEVNALASGVTPYLVRPSALIGFWPLDGLQSPEPDLSGNAKNGTLTGTAYAPGPPVTMFTPRWPINCEEATTPFNPGTSPFRLRFSIENAATEAKSGEFGLYVKKNSGSYTAVTTSSTDGVISSDASSDADDTAIRVPKLTPFAS